jgi:GH15 family glucan-1,4-alpha-glucosidase
VRGEKAETRPKAEARPKAETRPKAEARPKAETQRKSGPHTLDLASGSVKSMLAHQVPSGAFLASRDFPPYQFCWLRDGSFVAFALDRAGERQAAERFHRWAAAAIAGITPIMRTATERRLAGEANIASSMPPARYAVDGSPDTDGWPNFQVDGYGTWLWSLSEHVRRWGARALANELSESVQLAGDYLGAVALDPCYDCWEENGAAVHTSTLACVYGGLWAASELNGREPPKRKAEDVAEYIFSRMRSGGRFAKSSDDRGVDASLLWLAVPFGVVSARDPVMAATAEAVALGLDLGAGTRRYTADTYYGGGAWPLLTAWLGWYHCSTGDLDGARQCQAWVEGCFDTAGRLPEQVGGENRDPSAYQAWVARWGPPAADLAWSHAMYFVLSDELERRRERPSGDMPERDVPAEGVTGVPDASVNEGAAAPPSAATRIAAGAAAPHPPNQATQGTLKPRVEP